MHWEKEVPLYMFNFQVINHNIVILMHLNLSSIVGNWIGIITGDKKKWRLEKLFKEKELTVNHLHLKATSRTVLSGNRAAILIYLMILGSSAYLVTKQKNHKKQGS